MIVSMEANVYATFDNKISNNKKNNKIIMPVFRFFLNGFPNLVYFVLRKSIPDITEFTWVCLDFHFITC